jgi:hypothetical protein
MNRFVLLAIAILLSSHPSFSQSDPVLDLNGKVPPAIHEIHSHQFSGHSNPSTARSGSFIIGRGLLFIPTPHPTMEQVLTGMVCSSDAVVVAAVGSGEASLTSDGKSVFTDSLAKIKNVVKDNPQQNLAPERVIVIGRNGGEVQLSPGVKFKVIDENSPPFVDGNEYLIFMRYVASSRQYISTGDIYKVEGNKFSAVASPDVAKYDFGQLSSIARTASCSAK